MSINNLITRKRQSWFAATKLQSDLIVEVDGVILHLHKFPLLSRSGRLNKLVFECRDTENGHIKLVGFPGGAESFELAAKFCYGSNPIQITASNVASLRCAAEYLEMTEDLEEGNLISKTESFLSYILLASWLDCITVLQSCSGLSPWAKNLNIEQRCVESISWKASTDTARVRWAFTPTKKHCILPNNKGISVQTDYGDEESSALWPTQPTQPADSGLEIESLRAEFTTLEKLCQSIVEQLEKVSTRKMSILHAFPWKHFMLKSRNSKQKASQFSVPVLNELGVKTDENHAMPSSQVAKPNNSNKPRRNST